MENFLVSKEKSFIVSASVPDHLVIENKFSSNLNAKPENLHKRDGADADAETEDTSDTRQKPGENIS